MPAGAANVSMSAPRLLCMLGRCIQLPVDSAHVGLGAKQWDRRAGTVHQADSAVENCDKCLVGFCLWSSVEVGWPGKRKGVLSQVSQRQSTAQEVDYCYKERPRS
ncbi:uncharacterized protein LOC144107038 isoform X2 [Amblyomma americanum]